MKKDYRVRASIAALLSAVFYGVSVPFVKVFDTAGSASWVSSLLYFGAALAMLVVMGTSKISGKTETLGGEHLTTAQIPRLALMVALNAVSAISLVAGIALCDPSTASLLGNLEVAATAVLAWLIFREPMSAKMIGAVIVITIAGFLLSWSGEGLDFSPGALLIVVACVFWGLENNCTRSLSAYNVVHVTFIKGFLTGIVSAIIALVIGETLVLETIPQLLGVGVVSYGLSIVLYIWAQRHIGAARTGNYYSIAPFVGVTASWIIFGFSMTPLFVVALLLSIVGVALTSADVSRLEIE